MAEHGHDHTDADRLDRLADPEQYRYLSAEELRTWLDAEPDWAVADLGSGVGFYTNALAQSVTTVWALDADPAMHRRYQAMGQPENVRLVTAAVERIPLPDDCIDGAVSLRTFHHGVAGALDEVARLLRPGGRVVIFDWSATGAGNRDRGPEPEACYDIATVQSRLLDHGFRIQAATERRETFVVVARRTR